MIVSSREEEEEDRSRTRIRLRPLVLCSSFMSSDSHGKRLLGVEEDHGGDSLLLYPRSYPSLKQGQLTLITIAMA